MAPLEGIDILFKKMDLTIRTVEQQDDRLASGKKVFVGIDVHKKSWQVTVRAEGEEMFNGRIPG